VIKGAEKTCLPRVQLPSADIASGAVVGMGALWAVMGVALLVATEYLTSIQSKCGCSVARSATHALSCTHFQKSQGSLGACRCTYCILSALCLLVGATTTHGLGGALRHKVVLKH